jgi:branched-subunit amino acid aminotransferase/4-amino-4-deoxychorismate lyase
VKQICFVDGKILRGDQACVPIDDLGLQRGYAVFDYARVYKGKLFHVEDHLVRFRRSAAALHLVISRSDAEIIDIAKDLVNELGLENQGIRMILTGGSAHAPTLLENPRLIVIAEDLPRYPAAVYEKGVKLITCEFERDLPYVKTTNYVTAFRLSGLKKEKGAFEILYTWQGKILECARDNFFVFEGDTLVTPKDDVLDGITRKVVLHIVRGHFAVEMRDLHASELGKVDEAFLASTSKQVVPVVQVDDRKIGSGAVGERTRAVMRLFDEYVERYGS